MPSRIEEMKETRTVVDTSDDSSSVTLTCMDSDDEDMGILERRAGKMPSSEHAFANLRSISEEVVTLVKEVSENIAKYVYSPPSPLLFWWHCGLRYYYYFQKGYLPPISKTKTVTL